MRLTGKSIITQMGNEQLLGIDFHDFMQKEPDADMYELAAEFGLSLRDVRSLKKKINRN
ncbi:hypothetical protein J9303_00600 [Bacillaceae bacterium Marseille-Q3522]|nr:hypothetical protein [Bacillaceae bacterium Marseille-Q3522]